MKKAVVCIMVLVIVLLLGSPVLAAKRDKINPFITNTNPFDGQQNVLTDNRITLQYNEVILRGRDIGRIKIMESEHTISGFTCDVRDGNILILMEKKMKPGSPYRIIIPAAAVKDLSGNNMKEDFEFDFVAQSVESATGSEALSQEEITITHKMVIDAAMEEDFSADEEAYLIAALKAIGVQVKQINVNKAEEEIEEEKPEETVEVEEDSAEEVAEDAEINTSFDVYLVDHGNKEAEVIQVIRSLTGLSLTAVKRLTDKSDISPQLIMEGVSDTDARAAGTRLEEAGAVVSISDHVQNTD